MYMIHSRMYMFFVHTRSGIECDTDYWYSILWILGVMLGGPAVVPYETVVDPYYVVASVSTQQP